MHYKHMHTETPRTGAADKWWSDSCVDGVMSVASNSSGDSETKDNERM